jgi:hypothetical protein
MRVLVQQLTSAGTFVWRERAAAVLVASALLACNQDAASSNSDRETHMGTVRAVAPPSAEPAPVAAAAATKTAPTPPSAAPLAGTAPAARSSTAPAAGSANGVPAASTKKEKP